MALVNCRECGKEISDQAAACPHCGFPMHAGVEPTPGRPIQPPPLPQTAVVSPPPPPAAAPPPAKRLGCGTLILIGLACLAFLAVLGNCMGPEESPAPGAGSNAGEVRDATKPGAREIEAGAGDEAPSAKLSAADLLVRARDKSRSTSERLDHLRLLDENYPNSSEAKEASVLRPELEKQLDAELNPVGQQWSYGSQSDDMSGKKIRTARVTSTNSFEFDFPYSGRQQATLLIRRHPRWGSDVILSIEKGQILCHSFSSCPIRVRFDDETAKTLTGTEPSDNSSESAFIPGYDNFTRKLGTAKRVRIEFNVYQQGSVMAEFDVSGFDRKRLSE